MREVQFENGTRWIGYYYRECECRESYVDKRNYSIGNQNAIVGPFAFQYQRCLLGVGRILLRGSSTTVVTFGSYPLHFQHGGHTYVWTMIQSSPVVNSLLFSPCLFQRLGLPLGLLSTFTFGRGPRDMTLVVPGFFHRVYMKSTLEIGAKQNALYFYLRY